MGLDRSGRRHDFRRHGSASGRPWTEHANVQSCHGISSPRGAVTSSADGSTQSGRVMEYPKKLCVHLKNEVAVPRVGVDANLIPFGLFNTWGFPNSCAGCPLAIREERLATPSQSLGEPEPAE